MFNPNAIIFDQPIQMLRLTMFIALLMSLGWMLWQSAPRQRAPMADVCIVALLAGIITGRLVHVAVQWPYFADRPALIWQLSHEGGLNWQAATLAALMAGWFVAWVRQLSITSVLSKAAVLLPWLALASWYSCATAACAYGTPIDRMADYPAWMTWLAPDIYRLEMPRFATQPIGMALAACLLLLALVLHLRGWWPHTRFWGMLLSIAVMSFGIAFLRSDTTLTIGQLTIGQVLDSVLAGIAILVLLFAQRPRATHSISHHDRRS